MMATVPHVTSGLGLRKFQADGYLLTRVYTLKRLGDGESILYLQASLSVSPTESQCRVCLQHATVLLFQFSW